MRLSARDGINSFLIDVVPAYDLDRVPQMCNQNVVQRYDWRLYVNPLRRAKPKIIIAHSLNRPGFAGGFLI